MFTWAVNNPGEHELYRVFEAMLKGKLSPFKRALVVQVCDCFRRGRMEREKEKLTVDSRARIALQLLKGVKEPRKEVQSVVLLISGMLAGPS
jgi:hypothetical protein